MGKSGDGRKPLVAERRARAAQKKAAPPKSARQATRPRRGGLLSILLWPVRLVVRIVWWFGLRLGIVGAGALGIAVVATALTLPGPGEVLDGRARGSVTPPRPRRRDIRLARRAVSAAGSTRRRWAPELKNAILATEDRRFYKHFGVSPRGIASAVRINLREGRGPFSGHGGSTITQQTAKLLCLGVEYDPASGMTEAEYEADCRRTTISRKAREALYAMAMELRYSKDEILTIYLNRAYLGAGSRGFEAAAQRYFGKSANQVDAAGGPRCSRGFSSLPRASRPPPTSSARRTARISSSG